MVGTTTTNASGLYSFTGLTPGVPYSVSFTAPAGFTATQANAGNDALDSDGDPATGLTGVYTLTANENNTTVDMGYYKPGCTNPITQTVCAGSNYAFELSTTANLGTYQWYRNGQPIAGATTNSYTATQAGSYSVVVNSNGGCVNGSCCPVVIQEVGVPNSFSLVAQAPTCTGATSLTNGQVSITNLGSNTTGQYTYQYVIGGTFDSKVAQPGSPVDVPANGVILVNLYEGEIITVRVFNSLTGCFADRTIQVPSANCQCPPAVCVPFVIKKTKGKK